MAVDHGKRHHNPLQSEWGQEGLAAVQYLQMERRRRPKIKAASENRIRSEKNDQIYWDDVALFCYPNEYRLGIREMNTGDVVEIDSYEELVEIDSTYKKKEWRKAQ